MDYNTLKTEIIKPEYDGMTDQQIADSINSKTYEKNVDIDTGKAVNALIFTPAGDWGNIVGVADGVITNGVNINNRVRAISIKELFNRGQMFESSNDTYWSLFQSSAANLVSASIMSNNGLSIITDMRTETRPFWETCFYRPVEFSDIPIARNI